MLELPFHMINFVVLTSFFIMHVTSGNNNIKPFSNNAGPEKKSDGNLTTNAKYKHKLPFLFYNFFLLVYLFTLINSIV